MLVAKVKINPEQYVETLYKMGLAIPEAALI